MQLGCLWMNDNIITVSLSGYINFLDRNNPSCPRKIIKVLNYSTSCEVHRGVVKEEHLMTILQ